MNDDPRTLRTLVARVSGLAEKHAVHSVMVGLAAPEGDLLFPEFVEYLKSALRMEDGIFRMTRERAVIHLADVDVATATGVIERLMADFEKISLRFAGIRSAPVTSRSSPRPAR